MHSRKCIKHDKYWIDIHHNNCNNLTPNNKKQATLYENITKCKN